MRIWKIRKYLLPFLELLILIFFCPTAHSAVGNCPVLWTAHHLGLGGPFILLGGRWDHQLQEDMSAMFHCVTLFVIGVYNTKRKQEKNIQS